MLRICSATIGYKLSDAGPSLLYHGSLSTLMEKLMQVIPYIQLVIKHSHNIPQFNSVERELLDILLAGCNFHRQNHTNIRQRGRH